MKLFIIFFLIGSSVLLYGQTVSGTVFELNSEITIEYVNIGIVGKNIGTISDQNGRYTLRIPPECYNDMLIFSCIGYHSYSVKVSDFIDLNNGNVNLEKKAYDLSEVVVSPRRVRERRLGNTANMLSSNFRTPFGLGYEMGILMENKRISFVKEINWNIAKFTFDTIVFRVNVYKPQEGLEIENNLRGYVYVENSKFEKFENILRSPVYVTCTKDETKDKITVDLRHLNLVVEGDFLVTFETVKILGSGEFRYRCVSTIFITTHFIRSSRWSTWRKEWGPGPSIWALVDVER